jgi:nitrogen PTS system EIIA component
MKLQSLLNADLIVLKSPHKTKEQVINDLTRRIIERFDLHGRATEIMAYIQEREALGGTSLPVGVAIPHARIPNFDDLIIAIALPEQAIIDGDISLRMVILMIGSKSNPTMYLNAQAAFMKMVRVPDTFQQLLIVKRPEQLIELVAERDFSVKKEIKVSDLMHQAENIVGIETPLSAINDLIFSRRDTYVVVQDLQGKFLGEIRLEDILALGIPAYAMNLGNLKFLPSLEPFEHLLAHENTVNAKGLMKQPVYVLTPDSSIIEACSVFLRTKVQTLPVVADGRLQGLLSSMDVFSKIFRE